MAYGIDDLRFETTYWYEDMDLLALEARFGADFMDRLCFHMLLLEASKLVSLRPAELDLGGCARYYTKAFEQMWRRVVHQVWGQWRYLHDEPDYCGLEVLGEPLETGAAAVTIAVDPVAGRSSALSA